MLIYYDYNFLGMHLGWWFLLGILLIWIFVFPFDLRSHRKQKNSPLSILQKRYASGEISYEEFQEMKKYL